MVRDGFLMLPAIGVKIAAGGAEVTARVFGLRALSSMLGDGAAIVGTGLD